MKVELPEIFWHGNRERIMSIDFSSNFIMITGGADLAGGVYMRLWELLCTTEIKIQHLEDLAGTHERSVNVVRFSPCQKFIASGSDDTCIVVWEKKKKPVFGEERFEVGWGSTRVLRGHLREIHDLAWSSNSKYIASGSVDGSVIIFDVEKAKLLQRLESNKPVHGVAWTDTFIAAMSTDRCLRIYEQGKKGFYIKHCIKEHDSQKLFQDETSSSAYFRRLAFSPNGTFLLASAGVCKGLPVVHSFFYQHFQYPSVTYPVNFSNISAALAVRFCPIAFKSNGSAVYKNLGKKFVWAVACKDCVIIYNSDENLPVGAVTNPHFSSISDISWHCHLLLAVCSIDGYVSFIRFEEGELGETIEVEKGETTQDMDIDNEIASEESEKSEKAEIAVVSVGKKRIVPEIILAE